MAIDPLFGLWFPRDDGGYYGIKELKDNPQIVADRVMSLLISGERPGTLGLEHYHLDRYSYSRARTINWDKSRVTQLIYRLLRWSVGKGVDEIPRPKIVEQPALMVFWILAALQGLIIIVWLFALRREKPRLK